MFAAIAAEIVVFACDTEPPSPLLPIRTGTFVFEAPICLASDNATAPCLLSAIWPIACTPVPLSFLSFSGYCLSLSEYMSPSGYDSLSA